MPLKNISKKSFFKRFLYSYIFILAFPVFTAYFFYNESVESVYEEAISTNKAIIGQTTLVLDKSLEDAVALVSKLNIDNDFRSLILSEKPLDGRFYYKMEGVVSNLNSHIVTRAFLSDYFIYLPESGQVLVNNTSYERDFFFSRILNYQDYGKDDWLALLEGERDRLTFLPAAHFWLDGNSVNRIPVVMRMPIRMNSGTSALVVFFLNNDIFGEYLSRAQISEDVSIYVTGRDGSPVANLGGSEKESAFIHGREFLDGERIDTEDGRKLVVTVQSDYSGLTFTVLTPEPVLLHRLHYIRNTAIIISFFTILVGLLLSLFFSSRNARPLVNILDALKASPLEGEEESGNPFDSLQQSVSRLVNSNSDLNDRVAVQRAHLREMTLLRILNGEFRSTEDMEKSIDFLSLPVRADLYAVVCLNLFPSEEGFAMNTVEEGLLGRLLLDDLFQMDEPRCIVNIITMGESEYSMVFSWNDITPEEGRKATEVLLKDSVESLEREYGLIPQWGGGTFVDSLDLISISHDCARDVLSRQGKEKSDRNRWYTESERNTTDIHYPLEIENRILYLVKAGEYDSFRLIFQTNLDRNRHLLGDRKLKSHYFNLLRNTFYRMNLNQPLFAELCLRMQSVDAGGEAEDVAGEIDRIYRDMCREISGSKKSRNVKLKDEILAYLKREYRDVNISLISVSSRFCVSSGYLSHFFKEQTGENFSTYLENLRIGKAVELLELEERKIQDILAEVGYTNAYSFRRAFKKVTGMSPSQYRDRYSTR